MPINHRQMMELLKPTEAQLKRWEEEYQKWRNRTPAQIRADDAQREREQEAYRKHKAWLDYCVKKGLPPY